MIFLLWEQLKHVFIYMTFKCHAMQTTSAKIVASLKTYKVAPLFSLGTPIWSPSDHPPPFNIDSKMKSTNTSYRLTYINNIQSQTVLPKSQKSSVFSECFTCIHKIPWILRIPLKKNEKNLPPRSFGEIFHGKSPTVSSQPPPRLLVVDAVAVPAGRPGSVERQAPGTQRGWWCGDMGLVVLP